MKIFKQKPRALRRYETLFVIRPDWEESSRKAFAVKVKELISKQKGKVHLYEDLGKQRLAYEVQKNIKGNYFYLGFEGNEELMPELDRQFRLTEGVIKYQTCLVSGDFDPTLVTIDRKTAIPLSRIPPPVAKTDSPASGAESQSKASANPKPADNVSEPVSSSKEAESKSETKPKKEEMVTPDA